MSGECLSAHRFSPSLLPFPSLMHLISHLNCPTASQLISLLQILNFLLPSITSPRSILPAGSQNNHAKVWIMCCHFLACNHSSREEKVKLTGGHFWQSPSRRGPALQPHFLCHLALWPLSSSHMFIPSDLWKSILISSESFQNSNFDCSFTAVARSLSSTRPSVTCMRWVNEPPAGQRQLHYWVLTVDYNLMFYICFSTRIWASSGKQVWFISTSSELRAVSGE